MKPLKVLFLAVVALSTIVYLSACSSFGKLPDLSLEEVAKPILASPQWNGSRFENSLEQEPVDAWKAAKSLFLTPNPHATPSDDLQIEPTDAATFSSFPSTGLRVTWLGHSSFLLEIDGKRVLVDPHWSERASPFSFMGAKRFYPSPLAFEDLPPIDAVLISHDHYDHLDMETVKRLKERELLWITPLGVGSHLRYWGVPADKISELDWWQNKQIGSLKITAVPSRHTSGRTAIRSDHKSTLWSGWAINGPKYSVVYSGDTSMHPDFSKIGEQLGPFDLSIIEIGAYNPLWRDNHLGPEQALIAHGLLQARAMLPVHWAGFKLSRHGWTAPIERLLVAAEASKKLDELIIPKPGQSVEPSLYKMNRVWWPELSWLGVEEEAVWSSRVDQLLEGHRK